MAERICKYCNGTKTWCAANVLCITAGLILL